MNSTQSMAGAQVCSVLRVVRVHVRDSVLIVHRIVLKVDVVVAIIYAVICS